MAQMGIKLRRFVDDKYLNDETISLSQFDPKIHIAMIAVSDSKDRSEITKKLPKETKFFTFIHPTALIMDDNIEIGDGSFIGAYSILTTNIKIGKHCILNRANHIGHDCIIGDFFSAMPGAIVSGNVTIDDRVYLGNNSSIKEKISVCGSSIIGMNCAVVKDINELGIYVGVPAKKIK
jgi:sugar O-acyltransferase (sialic acid O-acetyltransferase NeuD family)